MPNVEWTNKNTLQNLIDTIHTRLIQKVPHYTTMPTASADLLGEVVQFVGETNVNYTNAFFYKCNSVEDETTGAISYAWEPVDVQASTGISAKEDNAIVELPDGLYTKAVQISALPTATVDNLGVIYEYTGATTGSLINGYFYKNEAVEDETTGEITYEWHKINVQDPTAISEEEDNAILELPDGIYVKLVQVSIMPEAVEGNANVIYQFVGETTADYTCGYFYKNVGTEDETTGEITYAWTAIDIQEEKVKHWVGTRADFEIALAGGEIEDGTIVLFTDDPTGLIVKEVDALPTTDIKTNILYLTPKADSIISVLAYETSNHEFAYVPTRVNGLKSFKEYGIGRDPAVYWRTFDPATDAYWISDVQSKIDDNTYSETTIRIVGVRDTDRKDEWINLDGTINGWEKIGDDTSDFATKYELSKRKKVFANYIWSSRAITETCSQTQIDNFGGLMVNSSIQTGFSINGNYTEDSLTVEFVPFVKNRNHRYERCLLDWEIYSITPSRLPDGSYRTNVTIDIHLDVYQTDIDKGLTIGQSITTRDGVVHSRDLNGDYTVTFPDEYWMGEIICCESYSYLYD